MKRSRYTETQIISILKEADAGARVKDACRRHGISDADLLQLEIEVRWAVGLRSQTHEGDGTGAEPVQAHVRRIGTRELCAEGCHRPKALRPSKKREVVSYLVAEHQLPVRRATAAVKLSRAAYYKQPKGRKPSDDGPIIDALNALVDDNTRWGFWMCFDRLRLDGHRGNHKRVWRVYCEMKLNLPRRKKKRLPERERQSMDVIPLPNRVWSMDFMSDALYAGRRFRTLNVLDEGIREALAIVVDTSIPSGRVTRELDQLIELREGPAAIRCDNGPEFCAQGLIDWCDERGIEIRYIQPGKPNQNAFIERFNKSYRDEVLDAHLFSSLDQVREISELWRVKYNEYRPHDALGRIPPAMYMRNLKLENSSLELST